MKMAKKEIKLAEKEKRDRLAKDIKRARKLLRNFHIAAIGAIHPLTGRLRSWD